MSMKLYNQSAHIYELNKTHYINFMMKSAGFSHENRNYYSADANELAYKLWSAYEEMYPEPEDYQIISFGEGFAMWLREQLASTFYFPDEGLSGDDKMELIQALRKLYRDVDSGVIEFSDPMMDVVAAFGAGLGTVPIVCSRPVLERIANLGKFLISNEVIYSY